MNSTCRWSCDANPRRLFLLAKEVNKLLSNQNVFRRITILSYLILFIVHLKLNYSIPSSDIYNAPNII